MLPPRLCIPPLPPLPPSVSPLFDGSLFPEEPRPETREGGADEAAVGGPQIPHLDTVGALPLWVGHDRCCQRLPLIRSKVASVGVRRHRLFQRVPHHHKPPNTIPPLHP